MRPLAVALALSLTACGARAARDGAGDAILVEDAAGQIIHELRSAASEYDDRALASYVGGVGARVVAHSGAPGRRWIFHVLDDPEVNGYALVGGHVYVTRGMLAALDSEAELAAVLAHEIGHDVAGHGMSTLSDLTAGGGLGDEPDEAAGDRDQEYQADQLAVRYLAAAGYDPHAFFSMLRVLHGWKPEVVYTTALRVRLARAALVLGDGGREAREIGRERYLQHLDGLVLGTDPSGPRLEGRRFVHARAGFGLTLPDGLVGEATSAGVKAEDATKTQGVLLYPVPPPGSLFFDALLKSLHESGPVAVRSVPGGKAQVGRMDDVWVAMVTIGQHSHVLGAVAKAPGVAEHLLEATLATYRALGAGDRRPLARVRIAVASRQAPIRELVQTGCGDADGAMGIRLHGPAVDHVLAPGERFKCAPR